MIIVFANFTTKFLFYFGLVLVRKYSQVVQRYYVQYLIGFDAVQLAQSIQSVYGNQQDQQQYQHDPSFVILQSIVHTVSALSVKQGIKYYFNNNIQILFVHHHSITASLLI